MKRNCKCCDKAIMIFRKRISGVRKGKGIEQYNSNEGIFFRGVGSGGTWFCNSCWEKILNELKAQELF